MTTQRSCTDRRPLTPPPRAHSSQAATGLGWWCLVLHLATSVALAAPEFDFEKDTLVNIHIPKAGGSHFEALLAMLPVPGRSACFFHGRKVAPSDENLFKPVVVKCPRNTHANRADEIQRWLHDDDRDGKSAKKVPAKFQTWLWSRNSASFGWGCGVHTGFERLQACLARCAPDSPSPLGCNDALRHNVEAYTGSGRTLFVAVVRDPVDRFVSEFYQTFAGWALVDTLHTKQYTRVPSDTYCGGGNATLVNPVLCGAQPVLLRHSGRDKNVTVPQNIATFLTCASSRVQSVNRMTRMLAAHVPCFPARATNEETQAWQDAMLASALDTVRQRHVLVGVFERFAETLTYFRATTGLPFEQPPAASLMHAGQAHALDETMRFRIWTVLQPDVHVFREANRVLTEELGKLPTPQSR